MVVNQLRLNSNELASAEFCCRSPTDVLKREGGAKSCGVIRLSLTLNPWTLCPCDNDISSQPVSCRRHLNFSLIKLYSYGCVRRLVLSTTTMPDYQGTTARLRRTFHYPEEDSTDSQPEALDEEGMWLSLDEIEENLTYNLQNKKTTSTNWLLRMLPVISNSVASSWPFPFSQLSPTSQPS